MGSQWAIRYGGAPMWQRRKSGFTPVKPVLPLLGAQNQPTTDQLKLELQTQDFQREMLYGLTTQQLIDIGSISELPLKPSSLQNFIIPFLDRDNWWDGNDTNFSGYRIGRLKLGNWSAKNEHVWDIWKPCLIIASRMLSLPQMDMFIINTLKHGDRRPIDPRRIPPWKKGRPDSRKSNELKSFHFRAPSDGALGSSEHNEKYILYDEMKRRLRLGFKKSTKELFSDKRTKESEDSDAYTTGLILNGEKPAEIWILLDVGIVQPLFQDNLPDAVRFGLEYWIASILVHECTHAFWHLIHSIESEAAGNGPELAKFEPYFDDDSIMESGLAMENRVFGAFIFPMSRNNPYPSFGYFVEPNFPTVKDAERAYPGSAVLLAPLLAKDTYAFPVPVKFFEDVHQDHFWQVSVRMYGSQLFQMMELGVGIRDTGNLVAKKGGKRKPERVIHKRETTTRWQELLLLANLSPAERREAEFRHKTMKLRSAIEEYWLAEHQFQGNVDAILKGFPELQNIMNTNSGDEPLPASELKFLSTEQLYLLDLATIAHAKVVKQLSPNWDNVNLVENEQLVYLNRNMRVFNTRIRRVLASTVANDPILGDMITKQINSIEKRLELSRLLIFNPSEQKTIQTTDDGREYTELAVIKTLYEIGRSDFEEKASRLYEVAGISLFTSTALVILRAGYDNRVSNSTRQELVRGASALLQTLRHPDSPDVCPAWWEAPLDYWIAAARDINFALLNQ